MLVSVRRLVPIAAGLLAAGLFAQSVLADPRDFTLVNNTSTPLNAVFVAPSMANDWEEDLLGADMLPAGAALAVKFPEETAEQPALVGVASNDGRAVDSGSSVSNCVYNIKVVGAHGETGYLYGVDLCNASTVTFSDIQPAASQ